MHDALDLRDVLADEIRQRMESGFAIAGLAERAHVALADARHPADAGLEALLTLVEGTPRVHDWPYAEIEDATELATRTPDLPTRPAASGDVLLERLRGAWLGRCIGCLLGKPVEGWSASDVRRYLEFAEAWPLTDFVPAVSPPSWAPTFKPTWPESTRDHVDGMPRDDDLDYSVIALLVLERTEGRPTPDDAPTNGCEGCRSISCSPRSAPPTATSSEALGRPSQLGSATRTASGSGP